MELKEYMRLELQGLERNVMRVLDTMTQDEIMWRPACGCNSIGLILFHTARTEDSFFNARLENKPEVWETGQWYKKLNVAENEVGAHYNEEQVNAFPVPRKEDLLAYYSAVRQQTIANLETMKAEDFDKKITLPFGEFSVGGIFALMIGHGAQHTGEISYLRGLQRGMDK